jgi:hypothetical protein
MRDDHQGTTQVVAVDTPGAPGASCTIQTQSGPQVVATPGSVTLSRGSSALPIQCTKECYLLGSSIIPSNAESMAAGNVIFGGIIGLGVDARLWRDEQISRRGHRRDDAGSGMPRPRTAGAHPGTVAAHLGAVVFRADPRAAARALSAAGVGNAEGHSAGSSSLFSVPPGKRPPSPAFCRSSATRFAPSAST